MVLTAVTLTDQLWPHLVCALSVLSSVEAPAKPSGNSPHWMAVPSIHMLCSGSHLYRASLASGNQTQVSESPLPVESHTEKHIYFSRQGL